MSLLAIHPGALGDVILFARFARAVTPGRVALLARKPYADLLADLGVVDQALDFDAVDMAGLFGGPGRLDVPGCRTLLSVFPAADTPARSRLVDATGATAAHFLPIRPPTGFDGHLWDLWSSRLGIEPPGVPVYPARRRGETIVIHPGAGAAEKCWPIKRFTTLATALGGPAQVVFVLGPVERDRWSAEAVEELRRAGRVVENPSLPALSALSALIGEAALFVGNDSGPAHLAAMRGTPTVVLFGTTNPVHFAPLGPDVRVVSGQGLADLDVSRVLAACRL